MSYRLGQPALPAPYALPAGFAVFLAVGPVAAPHEVDRPAVDLAVDEASRAVRLALTFNW